LAKLRQPWADPRADATIVECRWSTFCSGARPNTPQADALLGLDDGATIYWRDGCPYCLRLRWAVRRHVGRGTWVDIWADPEAAAFVRTTNQGGNEVVPTVLIDGVPHTNPDPRVVTFRLAGSCPI